MSLSAVNTKQGYRLDAFGFQLHLWNESDVEWHATIRDGNHEVFCRFKESNLTLAKFHLLAVARNRAIYRWKDREFPAEETLVDSWEPITFVHAS